MSSQLKIILAVLVLLIPVAFFAGKGCTPQTVKVSVADSATTPAALIPRDPAPADSARPNIVIRWRYRLIAVPSDDSLHRSSDTLTRFDICSGARLPSGDSIYACLHAPSNTFTFQQWITDRIMNLPVPRPAAPPTGSGSGGPLPFSLPSPPLKTLFYAVGEASTRDLIAFGAGVETTASAFEVDSLGYVDMRERLRISGEALVLPKPPFGLLRVKGSYFF